MDSGSLTDLPKEVVESCLDGTHIDLLRLRAVCTTWRSLLAPLKISPSLPLKLQVPIINHDNTHDHYIECNADLYLVESTVYLLQPLDDHPSSSRSGWLVKFIQTLDGKLRLVNPLNHKIINVSPEDVPNKVLNLLDLRVSQVCKSYHVQYSNPSSPFYQDHYSVGYPISKILLISTNHYFSLMAIHITGQLCYFKSGDDKWTTLRDLSSNSILDIIVYKGNFYAVDLDGETIRFDSSLNETKVASKFDGIKGNKKRLVESSGQLFLVDMLTDDIGPYWNIVFEVKTYRLDEQKHEWTEVHTLDDRIFFAGDDCCFSLSSKDFGDQCRGNCIYYTNISMDILGEYGDPPGGRYNQFSLGEYGPLVGRPSSGGLREELVHKYKGLHGHNTGVFTLEDGKLGSLISFLEYADIFWPPPSWLNCQDQGSKQEVAES